MRFLGLFFSMVFAMSAMAQTPPADLRGEALRDWLKRETYSGKIQPMGYKEARRILYNFVDNRDGKVEGVYGGMIKSVPAGGSNSNPSPINCEHTVPQSFFRKANPMRSDLHHLFPTYDRFNSIRSNHPFAEIDDQQTDKWMLDQTQSRGVPGSNIDDYSESDGRRFEPREEQKGDTARAVFYFYTMYPNYSMSRVGDLNTFYAWHLADPVSAHERIRNDEIKTHQGNRNPFIDNPEWVRIAWDVDAAQAKNVLRGMGKDPALVDQDMAGASSDPVVDNKPSDEEGTQNPGEDRRADKAKLSVMTFNAEFLWDGLEPEDGEINFSRKGNAEAAAAHMRNVAEVIKRGSPDMVNLVEVEGLAALQHFNATYLEGENYVAYLAQGADTFTGQDVGLLTRLDPIGDLVHDDTEGQSGEVNKSVSKNYFAKFQIGETKFAMIGLHFLARPYAHDRHKRRQAQADAMAKRARQLQSEGFEVIILGDVNDYDHEVLGRGGNAPITRVTAILKEMGEGDADNLINVAARLPQPERYTSFWDKNRDNEIDPDGEYTMIDHIFVSPALDALVTDVVMDQTHDPRLVSDHFPVTVHFNFAGGNQDDTEDGGATHGDGSGDGGLKIFSLFPNPRGNEKQNEAATIINNGNTAVSLVGWTLKDKGGKTWKLDSLGSLEPGARKTIKRNGQPMAMTNKGDDIHLIDPEGTVVHSVSYDRTDQDETIEF